MRKAMMLCCVVLLAVVCGQMTFAQEGPKAADSVKAPEPPAHYYHLDFVVQELGADGKVVNSRSYTTAASTDQKEQGVSIRAGSRLSVFNGLEVGVNVDVRGTHEVNGKLAFFLVAEVTSLAPAAEPSEASRPVTRRNRWQSPVLVPLNKPTVVFTSDAFDSKANMHVVVTATPL
jgi:hypothetical protein